MYDDRLFDSDMFGFGVGSNTLYSKSDGSYAWLTQKNWSSSLTQLGLFLKSSMHLDHSTVGPVLSLNECNMTKAPLSGEYRIVDRRLFDDYIYGGYMQYRGDNDLLQLGVYRGADGKKSVFTITGDKQYVGIGTSKPQNRFHLHGKSFYSSSIRFSNDYNSSDSDWQIGMRDFTSTSSGQEYLSFERVNSSTGSIARHMVVRKDGRVGLGTTTPGNKLHLKGNNFNESAIRFTNEANSNTHEWVVGVRNFNNTSLPQPDDEYFSFEREGSTMMALHRDGALAIGTTNFGDYYKLIVNGKVRAKELVVETGWSDFVFEEDYELRSLEEVKAYIDEHGHLPEIPSAKDVEENGVNVGDMESKLLMKVEELTLYLIDLKEENDRLKHRVDELISNQ